MKWCQSSAWTALGPVPIHFPEGGGAESTRKVFPGFSESSDHDGMWAETYVDLCVLALFLQLPEVLSVVSACKSSLLCIIIPSGANGFPPPPLISLL